MAKDMNGSGLVYKEDVGTWSVYQMWFEHRVVFEVTVDNADPELKIYVGKQSATWAKVNDVPAVQATSGELIETKGRAAKGTHEVGGTPDSPGDLKDHIDGMSVQSYVYPRVMFLMAAVFVPAPKVPVIPPPFTDIDDDVEPTDENEDTDPDESESGVSNPEDGDPLDDVDL